jgi:peptidoglycan/LPS O-acetylase OafA/YrhL
MLLTPPYAYSTLRSIMLPSIIVIAISVVLPVLARDVAECSCGFQDDRTSSVYTDSIVFYFNETDSIDPAIFLAEDFAHKKEQGWNSLFKIGAQSSNAKIANTTVHGSPLQALEMVLDPADGDHLVNGASLRSTRRDIQHGLFEAAMRPARQWSGGTVLSYGLNFNRSNGVGFDFMNSDNPEDAHVTNLVNGEWPSPELLTNFTTMENAGLDPWNAFTNVRFSWNKTAVLFDVAENMTRLVTKKSDLPTAGQALQIKTWSMGDKTYGQGPPMHNASQSNVLWIRAFFNSSTMTGSQHAAFDERCAASSQCLTADISLRGYTAFSPASELRWKEPPKNKGIRTLAGIVAACCSSFGIFALLNVFLRRTPWKKLWPKNIRNVEVSANAEPNTDKTKSGDVKSTQNDGATTSGTQTPLPLYGAHTPRSGSHTPAPSYHTAAPSLYRVASIDDLAASDSADHIFESDDSQRGISPILVSRHGSDGRRLVKALNRISEMSHFNKSEVDDLKSVETDEGALEDTDAITPIYALPTIVDEKQNHDPMAMVKEHDKITAASIKHLEDSKTSGQVAVTPARLVIQPTKRVDYLSGLTTVACIGVTLHHFGQTFWPFVIEGYGPTAHYPEVEHWLHIFVGGIILSNLWIGPFFLTATRFLSTNYLKHGNLEDIAKKELRRAPRLFVPIVIVSLLQYFLISMGLTSSLQWLPSVTYSSWPYVVAQSNFGVYLNNIVELAYLIPNAVPEIVSHYCIGVLWTIPVQLQYTYVVLAATVVIRDIRNPWKRFGVYGLVILAGWYARVCTPSPTFNFNLRLNTNWFYQSWGACHWMGLVLSDLETTYDWKKYLHTRSFARYTILAVAIMCAGGATLFGVFNQRYSFIAAENSIHPDQTTGKPLMTEGIVYPDYFEPTLAILLFSVGLQTVVELSTWVQAFLSLRFFVFLNPMVYCIYLTHGFVMWTWGAWVCLACNSAGMPYWANLLVTLVTTYIMILLLAWILTPLLEFPTQALMRNIDRWTKEEPRPKRPTTAPFSKDIVLNRKDNESAAVEA